MSSISLRGLHKQFGAVAAVEGLDLEVEEGELIALLGPSGCGKTTTLRMVAGFEAPTAGRIVVGDRDVTGLPPEKRNCGMVFQNYALFPHLTVAQNVAFGLEMRGVRRGDIDRRVQEILERVGLGPLGGRRPRQLSGGQQQRTALARALVISPALLLLDEPLANLDAKLREEMRFYIRQLQREFRITTLYVTHDQAEALVLADRIAVMIDGRLQQIGPPEELYRRPANAQVAQFVGLTNLIPVTVRDRGADRVTLECPSGTVRARAAGEFPVGAAAWLSIRPEDLELGLERTRHPGRNALSAVVKERAFLGNLADYRVEAAGAQLLRVQAPAGAAFAPGDRVEVAFTEESGWVMPR